jgi:hypothetical protein
MEDELASAFDDGVKNIQDSYSQYAESGIITITVYNSKDEEKNKKLTDMWCAGARYAHIINGN